MDVQEKGKGNIRNNARLAPASQCGANERLLTCKHTLALEFEEHVLGVA